MNPADLTVTGLGWLQLLAGLLVFLVPGVAAADRWLTGLPLRWLWAPVFSFTLLALAAILLDFVAGLDVTFLNTLVIALLLGLVLGWSRVKAAWHFVTTPGATLVRRRRGSGDASAWGLLLVLPWLFLAHSLPHLPGDPAGNVLEVVPGLATRAVDLLGGDDLPYPVHVDEHYHMAVLGEIDRTGEVLVDDPYTGADDATPLLTVSGMRSERGWQVAMVQVHQLTGVTFPAMTHFLPALWAAYLGLCVWMLLRPAPGALLAAALTAVLPTTLRFLGVGFLVPSAFALPWVVTVMAVTARGEGPGRLAALAALITGGFFMHLVPGTVALAAGCVTALLRPGTALQRVGLLAAILLPLVWIYPAIAADARTAVGSEHDLPFVETIFRQLGPILVGAAVVGTALAWFDPRRDFVAHRAWSLLVCGIMLSLVMSIANDHHNEATYARIIPSFFLGMSVLAGLGWGAAGRGLRQVPWRPWLRVADAATPAAAGLLVAVALLGPMQAHLAEPYYRVFDEPSWAAAKEFALVGGTGDIFLSHPWQAPVLNSLTGARPQAVMIPGAGPVNDADYVHYLQTKGADPAWLAQRGITFVLHPIPPNAPHDVVADNVFRTRGPASVES